MDALSNTEIGCLMKPELGDETAQIWTVIQDLIERLSIGRPPYEAPPQADHPVDVGLCKRSLC